MFASVLLKNTFIFDNLCYYYDNQKTFISKNFDYIVKNGNEIEEELIKKIYTKILNQILKKFELNSLSNDDELKLNYFSDKFPMISWN